MNKRLFVAAIFLFLLIFQAGAQDDAPQSRDDWRSLVQIARQSYQQKDYQKALLYYASAMPALPKHIDLSEEIAQTQYRLNQLEAAKKIYAEKAQTNPRAKARAEHNMGNIAMQEKDYQKAVEAYRRSLKNDPSNQATRYNLSEAMRRMQKEQNQNPPPNPQQNKPQDQKTNPNNTPSKDSNKDKSNQPPESGLSDQTIDRMLNKLMKQEANTKRKIASGKEGPSETKSGKDW
jgi:Ca-activated chloride channel family protein